MYMNILKLPNPTILLIMSLFHIHFKLILIIPKNRSILNQQQHSIQLDMPKQNEIWKSSDEAKILSIFFLSVMSVHYPSHL